MTKSGISIIDTSLSDVETSSSGADLNHFKHNICEQIDRCIILRNGNNGIDLGDIIFGKMPRVRPKRVLSNNTN